ncbi:tRNA (adenosine(37)-N6)-threonylcarbamoyltransferase complex dimerization subunit type 1 TsaB [Granulicella sp. L46]|uniref:tRNA (adenosine(37)-N6)-threonylcarbamoyltransferase complex dimerization subunit type 1 TsaB n=1 Tax=Granulicella sp. L46 TaxID=1641865 RepID=UPI00131CEB3F|nr:tRNA (adenosine(37)-N6)-threonylcarbamoyltransferase complex dimerization subunit type 1 TsaB [Granulicella sp. L46]
MTQDERLLLIDTCGETAGIALTCGEEVLATRDLARGSASAEIIDAIRRLLQSQPGSQLRNLDAIGIVHGPGSFTGIRAGLATAKGLCEAAALPMAAVSRLEVLANATGLADGYAALDAGRSEVYVREVSTGREWLCTTGDLQRQCHGERIALAESRLVDQLQGCETILHTLHASDARGAVLRKLRMGGSDVALTDANYVRQESDIYRKPAGAVG